MTHFSNTTHAWDIYRTHLELHVYFDLTKDQSYAYMYGTFLNSHYFGGRIRETREETETETETETERSSEAGFWAGAERER